MTNRTWEENLATRTPATDCCTWTTNDVARNVLSLPPAYRSPPRLLHTRYYAVYNAAGGGDWFIGGRCLRAIARSSVVRERRVMESSIVMRRLRTTDLIHVRTRDAPLRDRIGGTASVGKLRFRLRFCVGRKVLDL